jgi:hypothetical protein
LVPPLFTLLDSNLSNTKSKWKPPSRAWTRFALVLSLAYVAARGIAHDRALNMIARGRYRELYAARTNAFPIPTSLVRWRGIAEGEDFLYELPVDLTEDQIPIMQKYRRPLPELNTQIKAARATDTFRLVEDFAWVPYWYQKGDSVELMDLRFGPTTDPQFSARATVDSDGNIVRIELFLGPNFSN